MCVSELVGLRELQPSLNKVNGQLFALSVDAPADSKRVVERKNLPFSILADTQREVIRAYGLVHAGQGPGGVDIAMPAHVLIGRDGRIAWRYQSSAVQDRPDPAEEVREIEALGAR